MCYSNGCLWQDYMGDCSFPSYILGKTYKCNCTMEEYIDSKNQITKLKHIKERNIKIKSIKNKLLDKTL